ncbi:MAG: OmpH family outer membrane protein [Candidatus Omnitrophota bacterium]
MKRIGLVLLAAVFVFGVSSKAFAVEKFAHVDLGKAFSDYKKTIDYDKVMSDKEVAFKAELTKKGDELKALQEKMSLLSDKDKEAKAADFKNKITSFKEYEDGRMQDLRKEHDDKMKEIFKDIEDTVKKYSEGQGYTFVLDDRILVYKAKGYDITDKIIEDLNKSYKGK